MTPTHVVAAVLQKDRRVLIARRKEGKSMAGFWEFPGGKVEEGEDPKEALKRELQEEMDVLVTVGDFVGECVHDYPNFTIRLSAYACFTKDEILSSTDHDQIKWILPKEWSDYDLAPADIPIMKQLML